MEAEKNNETSNPDNVAESPISVWLADPNVLACAICFEPMTIPVFQCENGHTGCSSCCVKIHNKCPSCLLPIGIRSRAIEKILESAMIVCQNQKLGCKETISYNNKKEHEKACKYKPRTCPFAGCSFVSSYEQLSLHFTANHPGFTVQFSFSGYFEVKLDVGARFMVLHEEKGNVMFGLHRREEHLGSVIWLSHLSLKLSKEIILYNVSASGKLWRSLSLHSIRICSRSQADDDALPSEGFFVIPSDFFCTSDVFAFDLVIYEGCSC